MYEFINRIANVIRGWFGLRRVYRIRAKTGKIKVPFGRL